MVRGNVPTHGGLVAVLGDVVAEDALDRVEGLLQVILDLQHDPLDVLTVERVSPVKSWQILVRFCVHAVFSIRDVGKFQLVEYLKFSWFLTSRIPSFIP